MSSLVEEFLKGTQRVTMRVYYYRPLDIGQAPLEIKPEIIGAKPVIVPHSTILQTFDHQMDDRTDLEDKRLAKVFEQLVIANNGIVRIQDRSQRLSVMQDDIEGSRLANIVPVLIPRPSEQANPGMKETVDTFKTMIPFPRVRKFLQNWQENLDGPLHHVQLAVGSMAHGGYQRHMAVN